MTDQTSAGAAWRVLHVVTDRDRRGAQVFASDLARGLSDIGVDGEVVALAPGVHGDLLPIPTLGPSRRSWRTFRELRRRAGDHDIVVAHGSATLLACAVALLGSGTPFLYRQISDPRHWASSWSRRLRVGLMLRRAEGVVVLSLGVAEVFSAHYRMAVDRLRVIPNAVPDGSFTPATPEARAAARRQLGLGSGVVVVYVGALAAEKGVDLAVRALGTCPPDATLLVVGAGPERDALEQLADEVATGRVRFTGALDDATQAYHAADALVLPSRAGDSMPAVLIEAGLCALPVVATPVGAIADVVEHERTGLVVPIGDQAAFDEAVRRLVESPDLRARYGPAARERCLAQFTIAATAPLWASLLDGLRRPRGTGRPAWRPRFRG